ncbi:hypothetical protein [Streptomyces sp. NBC_01285]|uniref:hypothetical protein n=1 Tax=Streptomyces sp. NBC_01285 TaxID=2903813 RepID=UPI002250A8D5|nr:hypothetical protein [Streptomyces sp. NBC_01285]
MAQERAGWVRVPVGDGAVRWATRGKCLRVLVVVHNVTSATRLLDVLPLFDGDLRIQLLATCPESSAFSAGTAELLAGTGVPVLPWEQAVETPVDLAVSASFGGQLELLRGKLTILSHGVGYTKRLAAPDTGHRTPDTGPGTGTGTGAGADPAPVFGQAPQWVLANGVPIADALVLSHPEQCDRLRAACPEAAPTAVLAGDPCFDRVLAARPYRERFRRALGVRAGQRLIVLNSTWNPESFFGDGGAGGDDLLPALLPRLAREFPVDEYRFAAVLHPNIWHGHGPGQVRAWLDRARRCGLVLIDPLEGWRQALVAADAVVGDHGSVTFYAAALGTPVLLAAAPLHELDPGAPVSDFMREAPRLDPREPLREQIDRLIEHHRPLPGPAAYTTSVPGEAAVRLRTLFYSMMGAAEPEWPASLDPLPLPGHEPVSVTAPLHVLTRVPSPGEVVVTRWAGSPPAAECAGGEMHIAVHEDTRDVDQLELADVIFRDGLPDDPRFGSPAIWTEEVLQRHPGCALAAFTVGPAECVVRPRGGEPLRLLSSPETAVDPAAAASALHALLGAGEAGGDVTATRLAKLVADGGFAVRVGARRVRMRVVGLHPG